MRRSPDRRSRPLPRWRAGGAALVIALLAGDSVGADVAGLVIDRDTGEPIEGAFVFQAVPAASRAADVPRFARVEVARSDARGVFAFPDPSEASMLSLAWWRAWLSSSRPPRYHAYHPSYGLVWGREATDGRVRIALSLRDAHLRSRDARALCVGARPGAPEVDAPIDDALRETVRRAACPPADPDRFANGRARATGEVDARGRRHGPWRFYRADGSLRAEGHYHAGAATGEWVFHPRPAR